MSGSIRTVVGALAAATLTACSANQSSMPVPLPAGGVKPAVVEHVMRTRSSAQPFAGGNLLYNGGAVETTPAIYVVFWGFTTDPSKEAPYLTNFLNGVGGSSWLNVDSQYFETGNIHIANPTGQLKGTWFDNSTPPRHLSDSNIQAEAAKAVSHFGYNSNADYFVATAHGHNTRGFGSSYCAYHSATSTSFGEASYTNLPYITDAGANCGENSVNAGAAGVLDGVSIVGGHELAETQTDPFPSSGWVDNSGSEIGDKCAWMNLTDITLSTGTFAVQPLWNNAVSGCATHYP